MRKSGAKGRGFKGFEGFGMASWLYNKAIWLQVLRYGRGDRKKKA